MKLYEMFGRSERVEVKHSDKFYFVGEHSIINSITGEIIDPIQALDILRDCTINERVISFYDAANLFVKSFRCADNKISLLELSLDENNSSWYHTSIDNGIYLMPPSMSKLFRDQIIEAFPEYDNKSCILFLEYHEDNNCYCYTIRD